MTISRNPEAIWTELEGHVFALHLASRRYYELTGIGPFIWNELDEPMERSALVARIVERYSVSAERCEADVADFLEVLEGAGLVSTVAGSPSSV